MRVVVAPLSRFGDGERRIVEVGGRSIGVFRVGESFYGIRNRCPHQGGPLCLGHVLGDAVADSPGNASISSDPLRIACPWHGWEYDLDGGQSFLGGAMAGVRSYGALPEEVLDGGAPRPQLSSMTGRTARCCKTCCKQDEFRPIRACREPLCRHLMPPT